MQGDPIQSSEVILQLLQLIALTLPVVAILTQVMVQGLIIEGDGVPSWAGKFTFIAVGLSTLFLCTAAINLVDELGGLMSQSVIETATSSIIGGFWLLAIAVFLGLWELWKANRSETDGEGGETTNTPERQSSLEEYEDQ